MKRKHLLLILVCDAVLIVGVLFWLSACGIQRPIMRPSEIPAFEKKRQQKLQRREQDMQEFERQQELQRQQLETPKV